MFLLSTSQMSKGKNTHTLIFQEEECNGFVLSRKMMLNLQVEDCNGCLRQSLRVKINSKLMMIWCDLIQMCAIFPRYEDYGERLTRLWRQVANAVLYSAIHFQIGEG